jgi:AraC family transcriptional regulator, transcriptional activator FtrA
MLRSVAVLVLDELAVFEFGVLCEVFGLDRTDDGVPLLDFRVCGLRAGEPVTTTGHVQVVPERGLEGLQGADLVAVPATGLREFPEEALQALRDASAAGATLLTVCSGVFVLGAAGLLDGRRCTVHWKSVDELRARHPEAIIDPDVLFVDDGNLVTSAGTAAGIDASLHLWRQAYGAAAAAKVARRMVVPPQREGGQAQYISAPVVDCEAETLGPLLTWLTEHLDEQHSVESLAREAHMSARTFARRFRAETGTTPHAWVTSQRILRAEELLETTDHPVERIAAQVGFGNAATLRHHFSRARTVSPQQYRRTFSATA